ncbi:hypothetical protein PPERSA_05935 [Pseudocohnilembus persalinus]|uniref:Uncharacterized protein n=1 Tax=Pseudocohnilembus persalinus TaxID=266149 RepID=A0A0V0R452_PSEPJ|nr:hypothetical protein PPERSA_05935 [Pseudocohnilembus persalinus]|eukprot:KRX09266.1 hypothetical protein PPERSA_05935 [Pseudocohnilembus persalinus]
MKLIQEPCFKVSKKIIIILKLKYNITQYLKFIQLFYLKGSGIDTQYVVSKKEYNNQEILKDKTYLAKFEILSISGSLDFGIVQAEKGHKWGQALPDDFLSKDVIGSQFYNHMYYLDNGEKTNNYFPENYVKPHDIVWVELDFKYGNLSIYINGDKKHVYVNHEDFSNKIRDGNWRIFFRFFQSKGIVKVLQQDFKELKKQD